MNEPMAGSPIEGPRDAARATRLMRTARRDEVATLLGTDAAGAALALYGTPVLLFEPDRVRRQYRRLRAALPQVRWHYAVKALAHRDVIAALANEGCSFDVATADELALVEDQGITPDRVIHTHPIKKPSEIAAALSAGVRTFIVDNDAEIDKFVGAPAETRILIRLSYRSPHAKSDLSSKFGVGPFEAAHLLTRAMDAGIRVAGFSFHVGSQLDDPGRFAAATTATLDLMEELERSHGVRFDTLDIGGGFPVAYDTGVTSLEDVAAAIRPVLDERAGRLTVIAEPGRILVAECMTLVTSVTGVAERADGRWCYLDDGVYGSYSNVLAEDVHPLVFSVRELEGEDPGPHRWTTLAGPTCDSTDVVAREVLLPALAPGDLLVSPVMGAYTAVTATRFNGRPLTPIVALDSAPTTGPVAASMPPQPAREPAREPQTVP